MDRSKKLILASSLWIMHLFSITTGASVCGNGTCGNGTTTDQLNLNCSQLGMIHVLKHLKGDRINNGCVKTDNCMVVLTGSEDGIVVSCNGDRSCVETIKANALPTCKPTNFSVQVDYECISDSIDICSSENKSLNRTMYLHSPGFPNTDGVDDSCNCIVTGTSVGMMVIESRPAVLNITADKTDLWSTDDFTLYNKDIGEKAKEVVISCDRNRASNKSAWIRITGNGMLNLRCWNGNSSTPLDPITTTTEKTFPTTTQTVESRTDRNASQAANPITTVVSPSNEISEMNNNMSSQTKDTTSSGSPTTTMQSEERSIMTSQTSVPTTSATYSSVESLLTPTIATVGAVGIFVVVVILTAVTVVCRGKKNSKEPTKHDGDPADLEPAKRKRKIGEEDNYCLATIVTAEESSGCVQVSNSRVKSTSVDLYSKVVPRSSRADAYDNCTFKVEINQSRVYSKEVMASVVVINAQGNAGNKRHMVDNDIDVGGAASEDISGEGMVENFLYHTQRGTSVQTSNPAGQGNEANEDHGDQEGKVINDLYHSYVTTPVNHSIGLGEPGKTDGNQKNDTNGATCKDPEDVMVTNDLYHSYVTTPVNHNIGLGEPGKTDGSQNNDTNGATCKDHEDVMVTNDLYHSYVTTPVNHGIGLGEPGKTVGNLNNDTNGATCKDHEDVMMTNDLYHSYMSQQGNKTGGTHV